MGRWLKLYAVSDDKIIEMGAGFFGGFSVAQSIIIVDILNAN
ncbi:hypothetical protein yberc0001_40020 [Yersinia bercovieri ATCC 43970]|uniref:Uncharacterized protein n=1 Tax=Yersinia bercovieri ATCC 43970 TaxID=349968 RepID=A0ABM9XTS9_YERBE|nr:hypothetical protein yberc0001_40020 [Yersinia bercovieri ATCC 43970]